jgi:hypothetical protein
MRNWGSILKIWREINEETVVFLGVVDPGYYCRAGKRDVCPSLPTSV